MFKSIIAFSLLLAPLPLAAADIQLSAPGASVPRYATARTAAGGGIDLVVWEERAGERVVLKANRIGPTGAPLDGEGIVVSGERLLPPYPSAVAKFDVAHDGEAFVVAWIRQEEQGESLLVRRIAPVGTVSDPRVVITWEALGNIRIAGATAGRSAITFGGVAPPSSRYRSYLVTLDRSSIGSPVELWPSDLSPATGIAGNARGYLAVFLGPTSCQLSACELTGPLYARFFNFDGTPAGEPQLLDTDEGSPAEVLSDGEYFFVPWEDSILQVDEEAKSVRVSRVARGGVPSLDHSDIRIDSGISRAVYSARGLLRRFEPLLLQKDESHAGAISGRRILVLTGPESERRLVIRSLESAPAADLAVVATGALLPGDPSYRPLLVFRIEHRGGAPVTRIALWWERGWTVIVPGETTAWQGISVLDRTLREGESFEVAIPIHEAFVTDDLWIAGDVVDTHPSNNVDNYQAPRRRGRVVLR